MGDSSHAVCRTCKIIYDLGYGSYMRSHLRGRRFPAAEHEGHDTFLWTGDYEWGLADGSLWGIGSWGSRGNVIVSNIADYIKVDLSETPLPEEDETRPASAVAPHAHPE